jgi:hypothetical protein
MTFNITKFASKTGRLVKFNFPHYTIPTFAYYFKTEMYNFPTNYGSYKDA